jgi:hypothetical protein
MFIRVPVPESRRPVRRSSGAAVAPDVRRIAGRCGGRHPGRREAAAGADTPRKGR